MPTTTIRIPQPLLDRAEDWAAKTGMSLNDLLIHALDRELGGSGDPTVSFLLTLHDWLRSSYPAQFPEDVTLRTFQQLRSNPAMWSAYQACIADATGTPQPELRASLHRRIGLLVKRVLRAEVFGRSLPLDASVHLISSYALLRQAKEAP